jgi:hypothetical protein
MAGPVPDLEETELSELSVCLLHQLDADYCSLRSIPMDLEIVTAAADAVAAIAVVASLVYLGRQIHIANLQSKAAARYSFLDAYGVANATIAASTEASTVLHKGLAEEELTEGEAVQFTVLIGQFLNTWCVMFDLHREGQLPKSQWMVVKTDIHALFSAGGGLEFWRRIGEKNVSSDFAAFVNALIAEESRPYEFLRDPQTNTTDAKP